jgi:hypothetical protein
VCVCVYLHVGVNEKHVSKGVLIAWQYKTAHLALDGQAGTHTVTGINHSAFFTRTTAC